MEDARWSQLLALIERLPPEKARQLRSLLDGDARVLASSSNLQRVLEALDLRSAAEAEPLMRRICCFLEPFLVDRMDRGCAGVIRRQSLEPWWEASKAQSALLVEIDRQYRRARTSQLMAEMERLEDEAMAELARRAPTLVLKHTALALTQDVRHIGAVLAGGRALSKALRELGIDGPIGGPGIEVHSVLVRRFAQAYEALGADRLFDPVWLGHAVMNHLARPWEVVTLIRKVTGCTEIRMVEETELAPLVDRTIDQLAEAAAAAARAIRQAADLCSSAAITDAAEQANFYFDLSEAFGREIKLERNSRWGQAYMNSRKELLDLVPAALGASETAIVGFLDAWTPAEHGNADHPLVQRAEAAADFIGSLKQRASRNGFGMLVSALERRMHEALGRSMPSPTRGPDPWPAQRRRLLQGLRLI